MSETCKDWVVFRSRGIVEVKTEQKSLTNTIIWRFVIKVMHFYGHGLCQWLQWVWLGGLSCCSSNNSHAWLLQNRAHLLHSWWWYYKKDGHYLPFAWHSKFLPSGNIWLRCLQYALQMFAEYIIQSCRASLKFVKYPAFKYCERLHEVIPSIHCLRIHWKTNRIT